MSTESLLPALLLPGSRRTATAVLTAALAVSPLVVPSSVAAQNALPRSVIASGGGTSSTPPLSVRATFGQAVAGAASAPGHTVRAGFWIPGTGVSVGVGPVGSTLPAWFALPPNRPNPFRGRTTLRFDVPAGGGDVRLEIFDLRGRRVALLHEGPVDPGEWELVWSGQDDRGRRLAAGIYLAVLRTSSGVLSRKLTLLR
jgi:hypothetical protein